MRLAPLVLLIAACGRGSGTAARARDDGGAQALAGATAQPLPTLGPLVLGMPKVEAFGYRKGPGHLAFKRARASEAKGAWAEVAAACREALAADPAHLDASYLLAVALAKAGAPPAAIVGPLTVAVEGDFIKWGAAALVQPALQPFLATWIGTAWQARVTEARTQLAAILARSVLVGARGDIYAYDRDTARFHRLTRAGGAVVATFRTPKIAKLIYVTRERHKGETKIGVGEIDLAAGRAKRIAYLPAIGEPISVGYNRKQVNGFIVYAKSWFALEDTTDAITLRPLDAALHAGSPAYLSDTARLDIHGRAAQLERTALPGVMADRDDHDLASALKIDSSKRIVTVPSPGMIDTTTLAWSPDHTQLAFVAQLTEMCKPGEPTSAVYVADAATGSARELARASKGGMALEWIAERTLAIASDPGVAIHSLTGDAAPITIDGADALALPRSTPACVTAPADDATPDEPADEDPEPAADAALSR